jgi:hypothetical protein
VYAALTVRVELPPALIEVGLSVAVRPAGEEETDRATVPGAWIWVVLIALVALEPWAMLREVGLAAIEKSVGAAVTLTVTVVLCVAPEASVPVTVTTYTPGAVVKSGETVSVDAPPAMTIAGLRLAARPPGDEVALRLIASVVPVTIAVLIVLLPALPCMTVRLLALAAIEKSDAAEVTVTVTVVLCVAEPSVPVTVTVYVPGVNSGSAVIVSVEAPPALTVAGLIVAVSPPADETALRLTESAVPVTSVVLTVLVPTLPCTTLRLLGLAEIAKSDGAAVTITVTDTLCVLGPRTPFSTPVTATV